MDDLLNDLRQPDRIHPVPIGRVIGKLDEYLGRNDYAGAERHLRYWKSEAEAGQDERGLLSILNEQIGLYRKLEQKSEGLAAIEEALALAMRLGIEQTVTMGTTLLNAATGYKSFGMAKRAMPLYLQAKRIYEAMLSEDDPRMGGLYNNMALTQMELEDYGQAWENLDKAMQIMAHIPHGEGEMAITCCNMADLAAMRYGIRAETQIAAYLDRAMELLDTESLPRDGHYAFICEKCAAAFGYHGFFLAEQELIKRAEDIYERT